MRILIVDDERNIRLTLKDILEDEDYETLQAERGELALELLHEHSVDLVILDVKLPGMDGIDVLKEIRKAWPGLDVLMISGHGTIETAVEAVKLGAYDFCEKPLSMAKILTAARNIREKRALQTKVEQGESAQADRYTFVGESEAVQQIKSTIAKVAPTDSKVLIRGESGTGKELVAWAIYRQSNLKDEPFITFNSAAIPNELVESELFGHEKGAFTGADQRKIGKLELAHGGTLFLDEIGDMSISAQAKILRVIQEGTFERVGGHKTLSINARIIAATHKNLEKMVEEGTFRDDLFYRLNVIPITIPPLRDRPDDVRILVEHFLTWFARELKLPRKTITKSGQTLLKGYPFPGNVRELRNLIERLYILTPGDTITADEIRPHLPQSGTDSVPTSPAGDFSGWSTSYKHARKEFERRYLVHHLEKLDWNISAVAERLGMHQPNLSRKIKELGIKKN